MGTIERQTASTVTLVQLEDRIKESEKDTKEYTDSQIKLLNAEYGPIKRGAWYVVGAVVIGVIAQVVLNLLNLGAK